MKWRACISWVNFPISLIFHCYSSFFFFCFLNICSLRELAYSLLLFTHFCFQFSVQKPREQVADAEALLDITNTLINSVKAHSASGITPLNFVSCLLREFGQQSRSIEGPRSAKFWKDVGLAVSHVFRSAPGCCTM